MPPLAIGIAGAVVAGGAIAGGVIAGNAKARAIERAASEKESAAKAEQEKALSLAAPTTQELVQIQTQIEQADRALARQERLLNAVDPALIEAGHQALKLLRGQEAQTLSPLQGERARQRAALAEQIQSTMGAGGVNSAAGAEQLKQFDTQTALILGQAQQSALNTLLGTSLQARPNPYQGIAERQAITNQMGNIQARQINALKGSSVVPFAGAQYLGDLTRAESGAQAANSALTFGTSIAASELSKKKPETQP